MAERGHQRSRSFTVDRRASSQPTSPPLPPPLHSTASHSTLPLLRTDLSESARARPMPAHGHRSSSSRSYSDGRRPSQADSLQTTTSSAEDTTTTATAAAQPTQAMIPRKLVLCFDGTGNKFHGDESDSNILKLFRMLDRNAVDQYHYYQPGIGTYANANDLTHSGFERLRAWYLMARDSAIGSSFDEHVVGGYRFLMRYYSPGDEIYIFGFSRGAYIARFLAEMLDSVGLLPHGNEEMVFFAWKTFAQWQSSSRDKAARAKHRQFMEGFRETFSRPVRRIQFLGLFDTVNSVPRFETAWMRRSKFPYTARSSARVIRHAVSIDERRAKFRQDLLYQKPPTPKRRHHHLHRRWHMAMGMGMAKNEKAATPPEDTKQQKKADPTVESNANANALHINLPKAKRLEEEEKGGQEDANRAPNDADRTALEKDTELFDVSLTSATTAANTTHPTPILGQGFTADPQSDAEPSPRASLFQQRKTGPAHDDKNIPRPPPRVTTSLHVPESTSRWSFLRRPSEALPSPPTNGGLAEGSDEVDLRQDRFRCRPRPRSRLQADLLRRRNSSPDDRDHHHHHHHHHHRRRRHHHYRHRQTEQITSVRPQQQQQQHQQQPGRTNSGRSSHRPPLLRGKLALENIWGSIRSMSRSRSRSRSRGHGRTRLRKHHLSRQRRANPHHYYYYDEEGEEQELQDMREVWFAGGHGDVGGGWQLDHPDAMNASHIPLVWMVREAMKAGLEFDEDKVIAMGCGEAIRSLRLEYRKEIAAAVAAAAAKAALNDDDPVRAQPVGAEPPVLSRSPCSSVSHHSAPAASTQRPVGGQAPPRPASTLIHAHPPSPRSRPTLVTQRSSERVVTTTTTATNTAATTTTETTTTTTTMTTGVPHIEITSSPSPISPVHAASPAPWTTNEPRPSREPSPREALVYQSVLVSSEDVMDECAVLSDDDDDRPPYHHHHRPSGRRHTEGDVPTIAAAAADHGRESLGAALDLTRTRSSTSSYSSIDNPQSRAVITQAMSAPIHDSLEFGSGISWAGVLAWRLMEYLPFRRMDLQEDGTWRPIRWPLPCGEVRDIPLNARIHGSVLRRVADEGADYLPGNLILGGGGRGQRRAARDQIGAWTMVEGDADDPISQIYIRHGHETLAQHEAYLHSVREQQTVHKMDKREKHGRFWRVLRRRREKTITTTVREA